MVKNPIKADTPGSKVDSSNVKSGEKGRKGGRVPLQVLVLFATALLTVSCLPPPAPTRPARDFLSEVQVFLQPVPPEARRLSWTLEDLSVVRNDGTRVPLNLRTGQYKGSELERKQTRVASGLVPPGSYRGVSLTFGGASLKGEEEDAALLVPEDPLFIKASFDLIPSEVLPLFVSIDPAGLVDRGFAFTPVLSLAFPGKELSSLTGYVTIPSGDQIIAFNRKTLQVTGAVATGRNPSAMAIDPSRDRAYVAARDDGTVEIIDVFSGDVREKILLRSGDDPVDLALSGDGLVLLTANYGSGTVSLIDPIQGMETDRIDVGRGPTSVTVNRSGTRAYVTCSISGTLSVIDLSSGTLSANLTIGETTPLAAALDGKEENLLITGGHSPNLTVLDPAALTVTNRVFVGAGSTFIVVDELSGLAFVGRRSNSEIAVVDPFVVQPVDFIRLSDIPSQMAIDLQEKALLVVLSGKRTLQKVDLVNGKVLAEMELDETPGKVAVIE